MAQRRDANAPTETRFDDHSVIVPPHKLKRAIAHGNGAALIDMAVVERAEAALAELKDEFGEWMNAECRRIDAARQTIREKGLSRATVDRLFIPAHDIKGGATTLGFPLAEQIATSLCRLLQHTPDLKRVPLALIDHHVDTIKAVVREGVIDPHNPYGREIAQRLSIMVEAFLASEMQDAYAAIADDAAHKVEAQREKPGAA
jgi:chemotaxis protein histidine kinase CheA